MSDKDLLNLDLVQKDLTSDFLFLVGTLLGMSLNLKAEQDIVNPEASNPTGGNEAEKGSSGTDPVVVVIALFLVATSILAYTAVSRLDILESEQPMEPDMTADRNINGTKLNIIGLLFRITGYILSIIGIQMKNAGPGEVSSP